MTNYRKTIHLELNCEIQFLDVILHIEQLLTVF